MGLSALSCSLLRRFNPTVKHQSPPTTTSTSPTTTTTSTKQSQHKPPQAPTTPRLRRFKDQPPSALFDHLHTLTAPLSDSDVSLLANQLSTDPAKLAALIKALTTPPTLPSPPDDKQPRDRLPHAWIAATLLRFGPPTLRQALSSRPDLIRSLASVFNFPPATLDSTQAAHVADVIRVMLHEFPKQTASALATTSIVSRLVTHVALQPAADLLPRLVSHRVFSPVPAAPLVAMHKRSIAMLGTAQVQRLLADSFVNVAAEFKTADKARKLILADMLRNSAATMADISDRAMCLKRKHEDVDERMDTGYAGNLGIITSHAFNDAKDHMTLLTNVQPLLDVIQSAADPAAESEILLPALELVTSILQALRQTRKALLPSMRKAVKSIDILKVGDGLATFSQQFANLLDQQGSILGRRRLALVDMIREVCETLPESSLTRLLSENEDLLIKKLLQVGRQYKRNDVLQVRLAQILCAVFTRCEDLTMSLLRQGDVLDFLVGQHYSEAMEAPMGALVGYEERLRASGGTTQQLKQLAELIQRHDAWSEQLERNELAGMRSVMVKKSSDKIKELNLEDSLIADEDYGLELYMHHLLEEVSGGEEQAPPLDTNVAESAAELTKGFGKGLSGRLKDAVNLHLHQHDASSDD